MVDNGLISLCRYYKGEKDPPKEDTGNWEYEKKWVSIKMESAKDDDSGKFALNCLSEYLDNYLNDGLRDLSPNDNIPITLKALLYDRFKHFGGSAEDFRIWYLKEYLKES